MSSFRTIRVAAALLLTGAALGFVAAGAQAATKTGALYQRLTINWSRDNWQGHDSAGFQIPGVGNGEVTCRPNTTWIQIAPADPTAENDMWSVKFQKKNGVEQTAVKEARVYEFSTPTSKVPHGTGPTAYEGFNRVRPIERSDSGSMTGLISRRRALNQNAGAGSVPTSISLKWSWSGFHTASARCSVTATFITPIGGRSRYISEGARRPLPKSIGPVRSFNLNWHGEADYAASTRWPDSLSLAHVGELTGTCQTGQDGETDLNLAPGLGLDPYAAITTYQGEGVDNSTLDDYYTDPTTGLLGPIPLPVNGFIVGTLLPAWNAPKSQGTEILVSSIRKTNDSNPADDYCEVAVETISQSVPIY